MEIKNNDGKILANLLIKNSLMLFEFCNENAITNPEIIKKKCTPNLPK